MLLMTWMRNNEDRRRHRKAMKRLERRRDRVKKYLHRRKKMLLLVYTLMITEMGLISSPIREIWTLPRYGPGRRLIIYKLAVLLESYYANLMHTMITGSGCGVKYSNYCADKIGPPILWVPLLSPPLLVIWKWSHDQVKASPYSYTYTKRGLVTLCTSYHSRMK